MAPWRRRSAEAFPLHRNENRHSLILGTIGIETDEPSFESTRPAQYTVPLEQMLDSTRRGRDFIGRLFAVVGRLVPPPAGLTPPARWGTEEHLEHLFGGSASDIQTTRRDFVFRYRSPQHWVDVFRNWYGPVHKAFANLPAETQPQLEKDLIDLIAEFNTSGDSTMIVPASISRSSSSRSDRHHPCYFFRGHSTGSL